jgi:hypothetical protein
MKKFLAIVALAIHASVNSGCGGSSENRLPKQIHTREQALNALNLSANANTREIIDRARNYVYWNLQYAVLQYSPIVNDPNYIIGFNPVTEWNQPFVGKCGDADEAYGYILQIFGIESRRLNIRATDGNGHSTTEVFDGEHWYISDATFGIVPTCNGKRVNGETFATCMTQDYMITGTWNGHGANDNRNMIFPYISFFSHIEGRIY